MLRLIIERHLHQTTFRVRYFAGISAEIAMIAMARVYGQHWC